MPDFAVTPRLVVGTFSYAKLPMVADLAAQGDALADHDVVAALAGDPDALRAVRSELDRSRLDLDDPEPRRARARRRLQPAGGHRGGARRARTSSSTGPPGTGKSQTIANLIATLAADGKRVLFVAEKRAAIDAVVGRLDRVGLGDLVLDLHAGAHDRRRLARELVDALDRLGRPEPPAAAPATAARPRACGSPRPRRRDAPRPTGSPSTPRSLHERREPWGVSLPRGAGGRLGLRHAAARPPGRGCACTARRSPGSTATSCPRRPAAITTVASLAAWDADGADDPWFGAGIRTADEAAEARERVEPARRRRGRRHGPHPRRRVPRHPAARGADERDWGSVLDTVGEVRDTLEVFRPEVFDIPLDDLVAATGSSAYRRSVGSELGWLDRLAAAAPGPRPAAARPARRPTCTPRSPAASEQRVAWRQLAGSGGRPEIPVELDRARRVPRRPRRRPRAGSTSTFPAPTPAADAPTAVP